MPVAVARQIENWTNFYNLNVNIKLEQIVLTQEQIEEYHLPRNLIEDTDKRKNNFEERYGTGAVELDTLEAYYPNELAKIIVEYIQQFRDEELAGKIEDIRERAKRTLENGWTEYIEPYQEQLELLKDKVNKITGKYKERLKKQNEELQQELEPFQEEINSLRHEVKKSV
jgi:gas vesicle protein